MFQAPLGLRRERPRSRRGADCRHRFIHETRSRRSAWAGQISVFSLERNDGCPRFQGIEGSCADIPPPSCCTLFRPSRHSSSRRCLKPPQSSSFFTPRLRSSTYWTVALSPLPRQAGRRRRYRDDRSHRAFGAGFAMGLPIIVPFDPQRTAFAVAAGSEQHRFPLIWRGPGNFTEMIQIPFLSTPGAVLRGMHLALPAMLWRAP